MKVSDYRYGLESNCNAKYYKQLFNGWLPELFIQILMQRVELHCLKSVPYGGSNGNDGY